MRAVTYHALRTYHTPRLERMLVETAAKGEWQMATAAARAWTVAWATDVSAAARLKAHLVARGRWRLRPEEQPA